MAHQRFNLHINLAFMSFSVRLKPCQDSFMEKMKDQIVDMYKQLLAKVIKQCNCQEDSGQVEKREN